jgi:hypothetical protein
MSVNISGVPLNFTNPRISSRIFGLTEADDYEIPYQVSLLNFSVQLIDDPDIFKQEHR